MADRIAYVGDTTPDVWLYIDDASGTLTSRLPDAELIEVFFFGASNNQFDGPADPIDETDPNNKPWNVSYELADDDTGDADTYTPFVRVTWTTGKVETYPTADKFIVKPLAAAA